MSADISQQLSIMKSRLDRQGRLIKLIVAGWIATVAIGTLGIAGPKQAAPYFKELQVGRLALVDENGVERVILLNDSDTVMAAGTEYPRSPLTTGIILQNEKGDEVAGFAMGDNGQIVLMLDGYTSLTKYGAVERVGLVSLPDGTAGIYLTDLKGNLRGTILTDSNLRASVEIMDEAGDAKIKGFVENDGEAKWNAEQH